MNIEHISRAYVYVCIPKRRKKDNKTGVANETTDMFLKKSGQNCVKKIIQEKKPLFRVISLKKKEEEKKCSHNSI